MSGDSLGKVFKVHSFGESHGKSIGISIEGCPSLLELEIDFIQQELSRRRPGQSSLSTPRKEKDKVNIISGIYEGKSIGSPICMIIANENTQGKDYKNIKEIFRPSHGDYTYEEKYQFRFPEGGGRSSARITSGWVAAGAVAKLILKKYTSMKITGFTKQIKNIQTSIDPLCVTQEEVEKSPTRCPDPTISSSMEKLIIETKIKGDSLGGIIECVIDGVPTGLGEPVFDKLEADLAKACLSIPATKGFEIGEGFGSVLKTGSENNDSFIMKDGKVKTKTNHSGGIQGGISNGMPIIFRVAFKPTSSIFKPQSTVNKNHEEVTLNLSGRHDPCVIPRAVVIVEAMAAIVLCDHLLRYQSYIKK